MSSPRAAPSSPVLNRGCAAGRLPIPMHQELSSCCGALSPCTAVLMLAPPAAPRASLVEVRGRKVSPFCQQIALLCVSQLVAPVPCSIALIQRSARRVISAQGVQSHVCSCSLGRAGCTSAACCSLLHRAVSLTLLQICLRLTSLFVDCKFKHKFSSRRTQAGMLCV